MLQPHSEASYVVQEARSISFPSVELLQPFAYKALEQTFVSLMGEVPLGGLETYANAPVALQEHTLAAACECVVVLEKAIQQIVAHYATDKRIQEIYGLDEELEALLSLAADTPYRIGAFRPDFLFAADGQWKICEIGARFPLNGWMISYYMERAMAQLYAEQGTYVPGLLCDIPDAVANIFDIEQPVVLVLDNEKGSEVHWLLHLFRQKGMDVHIAQPSNLTMQGDVCIVDNIPVSQFILEMDRSELRKFSSDVLHYIIRHSTYINDVRTLILVHDKRILAVLYDENIMSDYLSAEEYALLQLYLIPSYSLHTSHMRERYATKKEKWVLKQSSGGRGEGMYIGRECTSALWRELVTYCWRGYMVQEYVQQHTYRVSIETEENTIHLVGMLLCLNSSFCGLGIFRGSNHEVINVHQGRGLIFPTVVQAG